MEKITDGQAKQRARRCAIYVCGKKGTRRCCADCDERDGCENICLNSPDRCKCVLEISPIRARSEKEE